MSRTFVTSSFSYFVRTDGSDSNTGLVDSAGGAFSTYGRAMTAVAALDFNNLIVTVCAGTESGVKTFSEDIVVPSLVGGGQLWITGNGSSANTVLSATGDGIQGRQVGATSVNIDKIKIVSSSGNGVQALGQSIFNIKGVNFGACGSAHMSAHDNQSTILVLNNTTGLTISGGASAHLWAQAGAVIFYESNSPTISGSPAFSSAFALATANAYIQASANTYTGSATGLQYFVNLGAMIAVLSGGNFPTSTAGAADTASFGYYS
ncbi:MAG TPA: hypothetical protein VGM64_14590 [Lacunisphaera sp.]|jgi:hypothetical protein